MSFNENQHPRGRAGNPGQFRAKENAVPATGLESPAEIPDMDGLGEWSNEHQTHLISSEELGIPSGGLDAQLRATVLLDKWKKGEIALGPQELYPLSGIHGVVQGEFRADALRWYFEQRAADDTFDDEVSFYGADGPLAIEMDDGRVLILDGCHRFAGAKLRGDASMMLQVLRAPARPAHYDGPVAPWDDAPADAPVPVEETSVPDTDLCVENGGHLGEAAHGIDDCYAEVVARHEAEGEAAFMRRYPGVL